MRSPALEEEGLEEINDDCNCDELIATSISHPSVPLDRADRQMRSEADLEKKGGLWESDLIFTFYFSLLLF